jgi:AbrB family looped-hinge helix DNA binding protein
MCLEFISKIKKGNRTGTGLIYIPKKKKHVFNLGQRVEVQLVSPNVQFFAKIIKYPPGAGIYIPKKLVKIYKLLGKEVKVQIKKVEGFYSKLYRDGRIYIPKDIAKNLKLKPNDIVLVKGIKDGRILKEKYSKIHVRKVKNDQKEYFCIFDKKFFKKPLLFKIEKQFSRRCKEKLSSLMRKLLKGTNWAFIKPNSVIIFKHKIPTIINAQINYPNLAFYLGAYFADGTRKGNSWAICASTFEQGKYYLKMHNLLVKDPKPEFIISYTNIHNLEENEVKTNLTNVWQKELGVKISKFRIRKPTGKSISKQSEYGTLIIREHRQILLDVYNSLLNLLIKEILTKRDKNLAFDFLCGVMEGDGCVPVRKRGHIVIWTNKRDIHILENILRVAEIKFKRITEKKNKYSLRIGALEILRNFPHLKDKIFALYPKRRKLFFERLKTVGAVKFLLGNHKSTNWVKSWLKNNGFCDGNYAITEKGLKLKNELIENLEKVYV